MEFKIGEMLKFDIMHKNEVIYKIQMTRQNPIVERLTDKKPYKQFYSDNPTTDEVLNWLESRCFPRTRANKDEILKLLGLSEYNVLDIIKCTHGLLWDDFLWVRFPNQDIDYNDIKLRG